MRPVRLRLRGLFVLIVLGLPAMPQAIQAKSPTFENLSTFKATLRHYVQSGDYTRDIAAVAREAEAYLSTRAAERGPREQGKLAIVLDVDDTVLSSWPNIVANDFGLIKPGPCDLPRGPCGWAAWQELGKAPGMAPTLALARYAKRLGLSVFFISGRQEKYRDATERNLRAAGFAEWSGLILKTASQTHDRSAADFKAPARRSLVERGYIILLNMGDQESDLAGGYAERTFKLPNPFYLVP